VRAVFLTLLLTAGLLAGCSSLMDARGPDELCEVHHEFMESVEMPGSPEMVKPADAYLQARAREFPHSQPFYLPHHFRRKYRVYLCRDCILAEHEWRRTHPEVPVPGPLTVTPW